MMAGTARVRAMVISASPSSPSVMIRLVYASPRSLSVLIARTSCGTSTVLSTPPASRMYMLFGNWLAMLNMSACRVLLPNRKASSISRKKPITRDRAVPAAITAPAETSRETGAGSAGPLVGRRHRRPGDRVVVGAGGGGFRGRGVRHRGSRRSSRSGRRRRLSVGPGADPAPSVGGAEVSTDSSPVGADLARSLDTCRIRRAVEPASTSPAASAIAQPVVPFWVTWTSMVNGRPTARPDSVISWALTGTVPLALAVTSAFTVNVVLRRDPEVLDGLDRQPLAVGGDEHQFDPDRVAVVGRISVASRSFWMVIGNTTPSWATVLTCGAAADPDLVEQDVVEHRLLGRQHARAGPRRAGASSSSPRGPRRASGRPARPRRRPAVRVGAAQTHTAGRGC